MYKLPSQFDANSSQMQQSAAGGGSTSTTCSCCVVTLLGANILAARQLSSLARKALIEADSDQTTDVAPTPMQSAPPATWGVIGFFIIPAAVLLGFALSATVGMSGVLFAIAGIVGAFCVAYDKLVNNPRRGALVALLFIVGICAASALEVFLWLGAGILK